MIRSLKFLSHVWDGAPRCYLELLDMLEEPICRFVVPSLAASLESLAHHRNVACLSLSVDITLVDVYLVWLNFIFEGRLLVILID